LAYRPELPITNVERGMNDNLDLSELEHALARTVSSYTWTLSGSRAMCGRPRRRPEVRVHPGADVVDISDRMLKQLRR